MRVHDALVRRGLEAHGGREVKHTGDGITASFDNVTNAVHSAADIQRRLLPSAAASESLSVRIGIHAGEPATEHNDLFGATVQFAYRLCIEKLTPMGSHFRACARALRGGCSVLRRGGRATA